MTSTDKAATMRVLRPMPGVLGFYDGRIEGKRLHGPQENWLDDGGFTLGTCSYAIVSGSEALVYDTHMSLDHAQQIRQTLESEGATKIRVVLSHHHLDHIAGNAVFSDCEIIANAKTAEMMEAELDAAASADPSVDPVIMPTTVLSEDSTLKVGDIEVALMSFDIHSCDGLCLWLPETHTMLAGDTLEDTATYVAEPDRLIVHLKDLMRMGEMEIASILPNHGAEDIISDGGYGKGLIDATISYVDRLLACRTDRDLGGLSLREFVAEDCAAGRIRYFEAYEAVHTRNVAAVLAAG